jgi:hypothetical protein
MVERALEFAYFGQPLHTLLRTGITPRTSDDNSELETYSNICLDTTSGIFRTPNDQVIAPYYRDRQFMSGSLWKNIKRTSQKPHQIVGDYTFFVPEQVYYFHFVIQWMPKLLQISRYFPDVHILIGPNPSFVSEYLDLYSIHFEQTKESILGISKLAVGEWRFTNHEIVQMLQLSDVKKLEAAPTKVFISRNGYARHNISLEQQILEGLDDDVIVLDPGQFPVKTQIDLFKNVREVHGIHGGGLTNMVFMPRGSSLYEYFTSPYRDYCYRDLAKACEISYHEIAL